MKLKNESHNEPSDQGCDKNNNQPNLYALAGTGVEFAAAVIGMTLLGWWLDGKWGTEPWLLILGATIGFFGGMYNMLKQFQRYR